MELCAACGIVVAVRCVANPSHEYGGPIVADVTAHHSAAIVCCATELPAVTDMCLGLAELRKPGGTA
eukprot:2604331-Amphidinium_carterae.2